MSESIPENRCIVVVRIRGSVGLDKEREEVLRQLHLTRKNHATILYTSPSIAGTLQKVKDYTTWGEVDLGTVEKLLRERGMMEGGKRLTEEDMKEQLGYSSFAELAKELHDGKVEISHIRKMKPVFRLHPPKKGFKGSIHKPYPEGELGYRGESICLLLSKMM
ncbi:MAG: 50S ribosomal protein L30 [Candidatus Bathyarchaeia archaeon]